MKKILISLLLPITIILILLEKIFWEVLVPLSESIGNVITNIVDENYDFWKNIWSKIIKTISNKKSSSKS